MKHFFPLVFFFLPLSLKAGIGDLYANFSGGISHQNTISFDIAYEKYLSFHSSIYSRFEYNNEFVKKYDSYTLGGGYKIPLFRYKNSNLRFDAGAGIGVEGATGQYQFVMVVAPSFEYNHTLENGWQVFITERNQFTFFSNTWGRIGVMVGVKVPLFSR